MVIISLLSIVVIWATILEKQASIPWHTVVRVGFGYWGGIGHFSNPLTCFTPSNDMTTGSIGRSSGNQRRPRHCHSAKGTAWGWPEIFAAVGSCHVPGRVGEPVPQQSGLQAHYSFASTLTEHREPSIRSVLSFLPTASLSSRLATKCCAQATPRSVEHFPYKSFPQVVMHILTLCRYVGLRPRIFRSL